MGTSPRVWFAMLLLGLTGGIAMGKTTVAGLFAHRGVLVTDTDVVARQLVEHGQPALAEIVAEFGAEIVDSCGNLRRRELASIVFADNAAREKLEGILHPRIARFWQAKAEEWRRGGAEAGMIVIPLLFETNAQGHFDATICVACTPASQSERMSARGWSREECSRRVGAQWPVEKKMALSDYVIWSEGGLDVADAQVELVMERLGKLHDRR